MEVRSECIVYKLGLTQKTSQTLIPPCRASCFKSGNPPNALASLRPLWFDFPLPVRKSCKQSLTMGFS